MIRSTPWNFSRRFIAFVVVLALGGFAASTHGQVASSLINVGDEVDSNAFPGTLVGVIDIVRTNSIGGWAATLSAGTLSHIYGSVDGVTPKGIIRTETTIDGIIQNNFEARFGISDTGSVCYSSAITDPSPAAGTDSVYVDSNALAIDGQPISTGPAAGLFWSFGSGPTITANGVPYFSGGTAATSTGATTARGLWAGYTETPIIYTGFQLPGLPAPVDNTATVDFGYRVSRFNSEYILSITLETTGTGVPSTQDVAMFKSGNGLFLDGQLVQEGTPVPAAIGGLVGENWTSTFDWYGINDMGEYIMTVDTTAATTADELVIVNGMIVLREGTPIGPYTPIGLIDGADMNGSGDWAVIWDVDTLNNEALIFNGQVVLVEGATVDRNGDGLPDPGVLLEDFSDILFNGVAISERDANGDVTIYFPAIAGGVDGVYKFVVPTTPGPSGDLQLVVTDSPDPQFLVPGPITYTVKVRNNSGAAIDNAVVTSNLEPDLVFNAGASDPIAIHSLGTVTASLGTMAPYEVRTYAFVADAPFAGEYTTTSSVTGDTADTVPGNNSAVNVTEVGESCDLSITITDSPDPVVTPGGTITYTLAIANGGPSDATGVVVTMNLDPTTVFNAGLSDPAAMHSLGVVTINVGNLAEGAIANYVVVVNVTNQGLLSADASIIGDQGDPDTANNSEVETTLFQLTTDLSLTLTDSPDPVLPAGGQITYGVSVANAGPSGATGVTASITLDDSVEFVSVDAPGVHDGSLTGGVVSFNIGNVAAGTNGLTANIVVNTLEVGRPECYGSVSGGGFETDPSLANNNRLVSTLVIDNARGLPIGVFSNFAGSPTSDVPGLPGAKFGDGVDRPYRSPDGKTWVLSADTDLGTAVDEVIIVGDLCSASVKIQEGTTVLDLGDLVGLIDQDLSINNAGRFAFVTDTNNATTADEVVVTSDGSTHLVIAREGNLSPATGGNYGSILGAANIVSDNTVWFDADTTLATTMDRFLLSKNGVIIEVQEGVNFPLGQDSGATALWQTFNTGSLRTDEAGANYIVVGDTDAATSIDGVLVVNDTVMVQEGFPIAGSGFASAAIVNTSTESMMYGNGDWMARGSNADGGDWVLRNGAVLSKTGDLLEAGKTEQYSDNTFATGYFLFAQNNAGDYVVGSLTTSSDLTQNAVLTINGEKVFSREDDPIDLDGDGLVNDDIRIHTYGNDDMILTEDLQAYLPVTVRAFNYVTPADIGDVFVRFNLCGLATVCGDLDNDKDVDGDDFDIFVLAFGKSLCDADYHICADFDEDGLVTQVDYQQWLLCYRDYTGNPLAAAPSTIMGDFDRDGDVDLGDYQMFQQCAGAHSSSVSCRARFDFDNDAVVTPLDAAGFAEILVGP